MADPTLPPTPKSKEELKAFFGKSIGEIQGNLHVIRESGDDNQNTILLHNTCSNLASMLTVIIGITLFPEDTKGEAANESPIIIKD